VFSVYVYRYRKSQPRASTELAGIWTNDRFFFLLFLISYTRVCTYEKTYSIRDRRVCAPETQKSRRPSIKSHIRATNETECFNQETVNESVQRPSYVAELLFSFPLTFRRCCFRIRYPSADNVRRASKTYRALNSARSRITRSQLSSRSADFTVGGFTRTKGTPTRIALKMFTNGALYI